MKKSIINLTTGALIGLLVTSAAAADGQAMFLEKCGGCHKSGGTAAVINPADKAGQVWTKFFERGRHPGDMAIAEGELKEILDFISSHAADSDQPATAVIPK